MTRGNYQRPNSYSIFRAMNMPSTLFRVENSCLSTSCLEVDKKLHIGEEIMRCDKGMTLKYTPTQIISIVSPSASDFSS